MKEAHTKRRASSVIPEDLDKRLEGYCESTGLKRAYVVRQALEKYLQEQGFSPRLPLDPS